MSKLLSKSISLTIPLIISCLFVFIVSGCQNKESGLIPVRYSNPLLDSCRSEPEHKFYISQPESFAAKQKFPLIISIDPHGDGKLAVERFTSAMGDIPAIIAGSERIKNNYNGFEQSLAL